VVGVLGLFLLSWVFNKSETEQTNNIQQQQTPDNSFTPSQEELEADANSDELSQSKNNSLKSFVRDFTTKYLNYDASKPQAHIESLKNVMETNLYTQEMAKNKSPSATMKSLQIKQIYIADIIVGDKYNSVIVPIDVTLTTTDNTKVDLTYEYRYDIVPDQNGWKVVWITDESELGQ
jgi:hypothetical protein